MRRKLSRGNTPITLVNSVTEVDAVSMRTIGAYHKTTLSSDPHLVSIFAALEEKAEEGTHANATQLKSDVLDVLNDKIVIYLRAMELVDNENYGAFARTVAEIINDNNEVVKKRNNKDES